MQKGEAIVMSIPVDRLVDTVMQGLNEYAKLATEDLKKSVRKAATTTKKEIMANAPKKTGAYQKSWTTKRTKETFNALEMTVYSKDRYQLAHLLEYGHAKRGGGRVAGKPHIAPAETKAINEMEREIERNLRKG